MRKLVLLLLAGLLLFVPVSGCANQPLDDDEPIGMAVEFTDHAACAYIAQDMGWYEEEGLNLTTYESYVTGMALAAALGRDEVGVAYICLVPAINVYANAGVPIRIVAGTHKYGYGLVVDPDKVETVSDLENPDIRIGCVREGGAVDVLMHRTIDAYGLDEAKVIDNIQRMNPPKIVLSLGLGQLDAAFLPEQWATMAEDYGFEMLLMSQDIWPEVQGSVLVVKQDLIENSPDVVTRLVEVSQRATDWANENLEEAAEVMARQLGIAGSDIMPQALGDSSGSLEITAGALLRSMERLDYTLSIDPDMVQQMIDYMAELGYISASFDANEILDLSFIE
jgi:NitT/TauT family transport system substrate-binding protein